MVQAVENKLQTISRYKYWTLLLILAGIRVGISPIGKEWFGWLLDASKTFPEASSYISYSPIPVVTLKILGISNPFIWWSLWIILDFGWLIFCLIYIKKRFGNSARLLQLVLVMSQSVMVNLTMIGHYDNLIFIGGTLLLLFDNKKAYILSALLVGGANPYIGFASGICFAFYYTFTRKKNHLQIAICWIFINFTYLALTHVYFNAPNSGTRESIVLGQLGDVIQGAIGVWWFIALSIMGPLTSVFFVLFLHQYSSTMFKNKIRFASLLIAVFAIPGLMSFFILDHTRIGVATGGIILLIYIFEHHEELLEIFAKYQLPVLSSLIAIWVLTPPLIVDSGGVFRLPYSKYAMLFFS